MKYERVEKPQLKSEPWTKTWRKIIVNGEHPGTAKIVLHKENGKKTYYADCFSEKEGYWTPEFNSIKELLDYLCGYVAKITFGDNSWGYSFIKDIHSVQKHQQINQ